jgi:amino acid adenylation domain-containing protein/non-ribosomal peptide synthase protein (TIGR01720 family)
MHDYNVLVTGELYKEANRFWRRRLADINGGLRWEVNETSASPGSHSATPGSYVAHSFSLSRKADNILSKFASDDIGRFAVSTSAIALVLSRYVHQSPVIVGTPNLMLSDGSGVSPRLPVIIDVRDGWTVGQFLRETAQTLGDTYSNGGFPVAALLERDYKLGLDQITNVAICDERLHGPGERVGDEDILIRLNPKNDETSQILYKPDRVESFLVRSFADHFVRVLEQFEVVSRRLDAIKLLSDLERSQLVIDFNVTASASPRQTVVSLFEAQVERAPDATALVYNNNKITYRDLNAQANRLARHLAQVIGPGSNLTAGVMVDRSPEMVVAVLGVLKAGAAYVPIDPEYPADRINSILDDAGVAILITQSDYLLDLQDFEGQLFAIDLQLSALAAPDANLEKKPLPGETAYIIYTSGSTGAPKGCQIEHRNLSNYLQWANDYYFGDESTGNFGLYSSLSFDFTITNIFCALLRGKALVIYDQFQEIYQILKHAFGPESFIDTMKLTPSHIWLLEQIDVSTTSVKKVIAGGEELLPSHIRTLKNINPSIEIYNEYGPTEATVGCIVKQVEPGETRVLIGRPIENTRVYILDSHKRLVPVGVRGEICIAGDGVARGYNNRPDLTAERFIPNPFEDGGLLYKTGDIGRWLPDGNIQCFGRTDDQVKIRGYRIELGEIEAVLAQHPEVRQAVLVSREDHPGEKRLVAYIAGSPALTLSALREFVASKLPSFMVPASFVFLEDLPLNANGKIDRKALPAPKESQEEAGDSYAAPTTVYEEELLQIWQEILRREWVGVNDNFFEMGGDSLTAVQVISRVWAKLGVDIQIEDVFDAPTIAGLAARIRSASERPLREELPPIVPVPRSGPLPLSFAQQGLWFLDQLEPDSPAYNIPAAIRLSGKLDVKALERSLNEIIHRHEVLRTRFVAIEGRPAQVIVPYLKLALVVIELSHLPDRQRGEDALHLAAEDARQPFDLTQAPLLRASLLRLSECEHVLLFTLHHIITDEWSMAVLMREMGMLYEAFSRGEESPLEDLSIQYADYATWQREWLRGEAQEKELSYWKKQLAGSPPVLELPADRPRPAVQSYRGAQEVMVIGGEVVDRIKELSRSEGVTMFMALLGAFYVLLHRYTGDEQLCVGTPIAGRKTKEVEQLVGLFVNTLVMKVELGGGQSFREVIGRVREVALGAYGHQELPFEMLVEHLQPERSLSHSPLFQVMFSVESIPRETLNIADLKIDPLEIDPRTAKFDLSLDIVDRGQTLTGVFQYNNDLFDAATVQRMIKHFARLIEGIATGPDSAISELPLLMDTERRQLLVGWNDTRADFDLTVCIHQLFEAQAERTPGAAAVVYESESLTYRALNDRANLLAQELLRRGIGKGSYVPVLMGRGTGVVISLLAIMKAGGAFVPLDINWPAKRLSKVLDEIGSSLILVDEPAPGLPEEFARQTLDVRQHPIADPHGNPNIKISPLDPIYVIYTSGSTGAPKGVIVAHGGITNRFLWMNQHLGVEASAATLQTTRHVYDSAVWQLMWPLINGGKTVIPSDQDDLNANYLVDLIERHSVTIADFVPSVFNALVPQLITDERAEQALKSLRAMIIGGEEITPTTTYKFMERYPWVRVVNLYGPTEASIGCISYDVTGKEGNKIPIGKPVSNAQVLILDAHKKLVPVGVKGEIHLAGVCLGLGYLNDEEKTKATFVDNVYQEIIGERLYKTGDLGRRLSTGDIEYLGRIDQQVKVRGLRIELGEIESVLGTHPLVRESVVVARDERPGEKRLVAYVVTSQQQGAAGNELRGYLKERLPEYMIPASIVEMGELPLTPNGKIDRKALPEPDRARPGIDYLAPRNSVEQVLVEIWSQVLGVERIGIHDNFFELGGDSILSILVVSRASNAGLRVTVQQIFHQQTIAELATVACGKAVEAEQGPVTGDIPLTPIQHRFFDLKQNTWNHFNQSILLETPPNLSPEVIQGAIHQLILHHDALRLRVSRDETKWVQTVLGETDRLQVERIDLKDTAGDLRGSVIDDYAGRMQVSLNISEGPLVRVAYMDFGPDQPGRLLLIIHHLAIDGVSWRILVEDLITLYDQIRRGAGVALPPKTTSFKEWSHRLQSLARSTEIAEELHYWAAPERARVRPLPLEPTGDSASNTVAEAERLTLSLSVFDTRVLLEGASRHYGAHADEVLVASLAIALKEWTHEDFLLIDLEGHGREELFEAVDLARTVGWFTTVFPVIFEVPDEGAPEEVLRLIKERMRAVPRRGIGYGLLQHCSDREEIQSQLLSMPAAQVLFNYLGQTDHVIASHKGWRLAAESTGPDESPDGERSHLLEVNAIVTGGELHVDWVYGRRLHRPETIARVANSFRRALQSLLAPCSPTLGRLYERIPSLNRKAIEEVYALSPLQSGFLFRRIFEPGSSAYFEQLSCTIEGPLNAELFRRAWQYVVERHGVLRTAFFWEGLDQPSQVVFRSVELPWETYDWQGMEPDQQLQQFESFVEQERIRGFDLSTAPVFRLALIRFGPDRHGFCWSHHHILLDGWSGSNVIQEVIAFYRGGSLTVLPEVRPYRSYIDWIQNQDPARAEKFWREQLKGFVSPTRLPSDRERSSGQHYDKEELIFSKAFSDRLRAITGQHHITLNTLMRGVWAILLSRYSDERDICFGVTLAGRPAELKGVESMAGLFINTLPLRLKVPENAPLVSWLKELQHLHTEIEKYSHSPLADVQRWAEIATGERLFESLLVFENYPIDKSLDDGIEGLKFTGVQAFEQTEYPLNLDVVPGGELLLRLMYDKDRFDASGSRRILSHVRMALEAFAANPDRRVGDVEILTDTERRQLLVGWNDTDKNFDLTVCAHELFEAQAKQTPDAVALVFDDRQLTYGELNARANQLAHYLRGRGVGPEVLVGTCMERSLEMVVGLLGILKAGGAYVPLDPGYPSERLAYILRDAQVRILLTDQKALGVLARQDAEVICLDSDWDSIANESADNLINVAQPQSLAYVIYTSGSTGKPKGAMIEHKGMMNHLYVKVSDLKPTDAIAQTASQCFDISVWQFLAGLLVGARVHIFAEAVAQDPARLLDEVERNGISMLESVPSLMRAMLDDVESRGIDRPTLHALRWMIATGEALPPELCRRWIGQYPRVPVLNAYGPTECSDDVTYWPIYSAPAADTIHMPIGRPLANMRLFILDGRLRPVPARVIGELYIGGAGVGRGYLNDAARTAESFIPDPFAKEPGARQYKTGDQVRYLPDGSIEFFGRVDHQVKLRGYRIELGEIESVLEAHPAVRQSVVVARDERPGEKRLVAYVVTSQQQGAAGNELRGYLKERLPEYMIPASIVEMGELPLTPNGKIDRRALPAPDDASKSASGRYVPPRDAFERKLVDIWQQTLGLNEVGIEDDFFELGGHSILAVKVVGRIQAEFRKNLPLSQLFKNPTIERLANTLRDANAVLEWQPLVRMHRGGSGTPIFLLPGAGGNILYYYSLAKHLGQIRPVYGIQTVGLDGTTPPLTSIEEIARHNIEKIRGLLHRGPYLLAGHSFGGTVAFEMSQQLRASGFEVGLVAIFDTPAPVFRPIEEREDWDDARWLVQIVREIEEFLKIDLSITHEDLRTLSDEDQLDFVIGRIQRTGWWVPGGDRSQLRGHLQVYKTSFQIKYVARESVHPVPIVLFKASAAHDAMTNPELTLLLKEPTWGWERFSSEPVQVYEVPGDHLTMMAGLNVTTMAERLTACLSRPLSR